MDFNKFIDSYTGEKSRIIYLVDRVKYAEKTWNAVITDFITPDEQEVLKKLCDGSGLLVDYYGGKGEYERAVAVIGKETYEEECPIEIIKITGNFKFEKLTHRDYLGAVLSLGIKREKIGDINVFDDGAEVYIHRDIGGYVSANLNKIKHTGIKTELIEIEEAREKIQSYKTATVVCSSLRLDCVVSSVIGISRSDSAGIIKNGSVKLNYAVCFESSEKVSAQQMISIKGHGRFIIEDILGVTKKDRISLLIKKYT